MRLAVALLVPSLVAAGCLDPRPPTVSLISGPIVASAESAVAPDAPPLRVCASSTSNSASGLLFTRKTAEFLAQGLGRRLVFRYRDDYESLLDEFAHGVADVGILPPPAYVLAHDTLGVEAVAVGSFRGKTTTYAAAIVPVSSTLRGLDDLRGKVVAVPHPSEQVGIFWPAADLVARGEAPARYFADIVEVPSFEAAVQSAASGNVDAAIVDGDVWEAAVEQAKAAGDCHPIHRTACCTRLLWRSIEFPLSVVCVGRSADGELRDGVRSVLIATPRAGAFPLPIGPFEGFRPTADGAFRKVREALDLCKKAGWWR